jgi:AraC family transcriptional regulator
MMDHGATAIGQVPSSDSRIAWAIQPPQPYDLVFTSNADTICLVFGAIDAATSYDGEPPTRMRFEPNTLAFHPAGSRVVVSARRVSGGFVAINYAPDYRHTLLGDDHAAPSATRDNISSKRIANFITYARSKLLGRVVCDALEMEMLSGLAYLEAMRTAGSAAVWDGIPAIGRKKVAQAIEQIEADLAEDLTYTGIARQLGVPAVGLARAFKAVTGKTLHCFVRERRIERAKQMLQQDHSTIADIAYACGFCSQAHLTSVFAQFAQTTPSRYRATMQNLKDRN